MSREEVIARLVPVFRQCGYEGATLAKLSESTALGRASLYHHFPSGKREMAAAVLNYMNQWLESSVLEPLRQGGKPAERICAMSTNLYKFYNSGKDACLLAVLTLGESRDLFHTQIRKALNTWIETLSQVLVEAGIEPNCARSRAEDAILKIQGSLVLARGLDDTKLFERVLKCLVEDLLGSHSGF